MLSHKAKEMSKLITYSHFPEIKTSISSSNISKKIQATTSLLSSIAIQALNQHWILFLWRLLVIISGSRQIAKADARLMRSMDFSFGAIKTDGLYAQCLWSWVQWSALLAKIIWVICSSCQEFFKLVSWLFSSAIPLLPQIMMHNGWAG